VLESLEQSPNGTWLGLEGQGVLVAGAGGLGAACVRAYLEQGARVLLVDLSAERLDEVRRDCEGLGELTTLAADLTGPEVAADVVASAEQVLGRIDVCLHSVGVNDRRPVLEFTPDEWNRVIAINLGTAFALCQAVGRRMTELGSGRIVMVSSVSGWLAHANHAPYAASKGGMNQMMRVMAREWAGDGVTVNAIAPGYIETNLTSAYLERPGVRDALEELVPAGRLSQPDEVVGPVLFLSSRHAGYVTGHVLYVDGGRTLV